MFIVVEAVRECENIVDEKVVGRKYAKERRKRGERETLLKRIFRATFSEIMTAYTRDIIMLQRLLRIFSIKLTETMYETIDIWIISIKTYWSILTVK